MKKKIIVPYDFSEVANNAIHHALVTAKVVGAEVHAIHVVNKNDEIKDAKEKLEKSVNAAKESSKAPEVETVNHVRVGNIFDDIADFAVEIGAELIFMGTHGATGWQHITGSHALKVVTSSPAPFVIVQQHDISDNGYDDIVVPLDLHKETKQKLTLVANIAQYFDSRVHVIIPDESDEFLKHTVKANIVFANKFFNERGIEVTTTLADSSGFDKEVVKHAVKVDADLIAIMNLQKHQLLGLFGSNHEQYMITNEAQIPVLIVNPIDATNTYQTIFT
ncbi:universal stress protein [Paracrocinitomix mangrovi]|uniref:universal stress protein n=1 Tax=Paracrocinitomix mangrovi TaxID=2862509 RepID=UPI001C8ECF00|nr:universal stress protein [Paracrocinitomix mangrovi]UKN00505.1 universal stress protein [Paracrocinitomix mangrovi]